MHSSIQCSFIASPASCLSLQRYSGRREIRPRPDPHYHLTNSDPIHRAACLYTTTIEQVPCLNLSFHFKVCTALQATPSISLSYHTVLKSDYAQIINTLAASNHNYTFKPYSHTWSMCLQSPIIGETITITLPAPQFSTQYQPRKFNAVHQTACY